MSFWSWLGGISTGGLDKNIASASNQAMEGVKTAYQNELNRDPNYIRQQQGITGPSGTPQGDYANYLKSIQGARKTAMEEGAVRGEQLFGNNALGRLQEGQSPAMQAALSRYQSNLQGFSGPESQAMREQMLRNINQNTQTAQRGAAERSGMSGVKGAIAQAQQNRLAQQGAQQAAQGEQNIYLKGEEAKRAALDNYYKALQQQEEQQRGIQKYNLEQKNKELFGKQASELGYAGLAGAETGQAGQFIVGQQMAKAPNPNVQYMRQFFPWMT